MFKKGKKKEEKKSVDNKMGDLKISTTQKSTERRLSENTIEQRTVTYSSSSSTYSSVRLTKTELGKSTVTNQAPSFNKSLSLFDNSSSSLKPLNDRLHAIDAKPFTSPSSNGGGYQSYFSRKLPPYNLDAQPFNTNLQASQRKTSVQPIPISQNPPRYSGYLPQTSSNALRAGSSTQSLPTLGEPRVADPRIPTYDTNGKKRGKVLIINNIKFLQGKEERKGAETDEKNIQSLFRSMGFEVDVYRDLKKTAMMDKVNKFSSDSSLKKGDISVVIMMSHGSNVDNSGRVIGGGFTQIYGIDSVGLPIDDVLDRFSAEKCPAMSGKPKIFIFQCCRGETAERTLHNDGTPMRNIVKKNADMLIAFSTLPDCMSLNDWASIIEGIEGMVTGPQGCWNKAIMCTLLQAGNTTEDFYRNRTHYGFFSIRDTQQGSWYIQGICDVFKKHAKEFDVETLLKIVDEQLSQKHPTYQQTSTYESRGFKRCFFNPK